ncbi:EAL domain-containing protein [Colwellia hornerae]|nr:EAL domain-containing protein [Colwellia hornerae]
MQESEKSKLEHLELVIQATEVGLWDWQIQTGEIFFNGDCADIIGYSLTELQPIQFEKWTEYIHPEDFIIANKLLEKHFQGQNKRFEVEVRMKHKQGQYVWVLATGKTIEWHENGLPKRMIGIHQNIAQRKLNDQKIITTSHLLDESQKIAKVGGWQLDLLSGDLFWTAETYRIYETSPEEFNPTVDAGVNYFSPKSKHMITKALDAAINQGIGYDLELETYTTKGKLIDVRTTCIVKKEAGKIAKLVGIFQDISAEKSIQRILKNSYRELESSQALINKLINTVPDMIWLKDKKGVYLFCNSKFARMFGEQEGNIIGKTDNDFVDKKLANFFQEDDKNAMLADGSIINEESLTFADDGRSEIVETIKTPIKDSDGNLIGILGVARDITNYKNSLVQLKKSESKLKEAQAYAKIGSWELYSDQENASWSDQMYTLFGLVRESNAGVETLRDVINESDFPTFIASVKACFSSGHEHHVEYRITRPNDGEERWIESRGKVVTNSDGIPQIMTGFIQDITERKNAEDTLRQSEATIRKKLKAILEPDANIDALELSDIIDAEVLQSLMDDFYHLTGMLGAILDIKGNVLVAVGWQDICNQFHRCNHETRKNCIESDTILTLGIQHGKFKAYHCKNNMWDMATPIIIGGKHLGNVFIGQFFYKDEVPDVALFKTQAKRYGFDEKTYLAALDKVPRFTHEEVSKGMHFYAKLADIISTSSFSAIKQSRLLAERKLSEEKLKLAASVFTHARESIAITDASGVILDVNHTFSKTTGYSLEESMGNNPRIFQSGLQSSEFYVEMWQALLKEGYWSGEIWNRRKNDEIYAEFKTISAVSDENGVTTHYVALGYDITPMKAHQDQLEHIAHYDILTNLPNRVLLSDRLSQAKLHCKRHGKSLAVVFLDLDGFKHVNDTHGHDVGDELLITLSARMKAALREGDSLARIGGDEFVAVLTDLTTVDDCEPILERFLLAASEPATIGDVVLNVSASIGVTLYPQDNVDADLLMRHADQAMYVAKESGKNRYHLFDTVQDDAIKIRRESLEAIRSALDNQQFVLHYQPKVNMRTGKVIGTEALIRWQHPERGLLNPIEFLPIIESNPMMIEVGEWVIDATLTQISQWLAMGVDIPVNTSVNIAAVQLQQPEFTQRLTALLAAHPHVEPRYLELEVLETSALDDVAHISDIMTDCLALGVNFALDDFGTGYSSLTYLRRLPANLIKIDQSFVRDMLDNADDLAIVESVIALAKSFKREVIAEGVETVEHGTALIKMGCDLAQGYGIAKPMPASDFPAWLSHWRPDVSWQT